MLKRSWDEGQQGEVRRRPTRKPPLLTNPRRGCSWPRRADHSPRRPSQVEETAVWRSHTAVLGAVVRQFLSNAEDRLLALKEIVENVLPQVSPCGPRALWA